MKKKKKKIQKKRIITQIILLALAFFIFIISAVKKYQLETKFFSHLQKAVTTNDVKIASNELNAAINYLECNKLTKGNTGIFKKEEANDIGAWYSKLKEAQAKLEELSNSTYISAIETNEALTNLKEMFATSNGMPNNIERQPIKYIYWFPYAIMSLAGLNVIIFFFSSSVKMLKRDKKKILNYSL